MLALLTIGVYAKLRVQALDEGYTRLFVSKSLLPQVAEAIPVLQARWHGCVQQLPAA
jgi:hypothetical protein